MEDTNGTGAETGSGMQDIDAVRGERAGATAVAGRVVRLEVGIPTQAIVEDVCGRRIRVEALDEAVAGALGARFNRVVVLVGFGRWAANGKLTGLRADEVHECPLTAGTPTERLARVATDKADNDAPGTEAGVVA